MYNKLYLSDGNYITYEKIKGKAKYPTIIFLGGFRSDMTGTKATHIRDFCQKNCYSFIRFDYFGHGMSSGDFKNGTISIWRDNVLSVIDHLTEKSEKIILIGSSLGGWLMLLCALQRKQKIHSLIGLASAPDFTENLIFNLLSPLQKNDLLIKGFIDLKSDYDEKPYYISKNLINDGRNNLVLTNSKIDISCPVYLICGKLDKDVPASISQEIYDKLTSSKKSLIIIDDADHRIARPQDLELICNTVTTSLNA